MAHIFPESSTKARSVNRKIGGIEITRLSRGLKNEWHWALKLFEILESQRGLIKLLGSEKFIELFERISQALSVVSSRYSDLLIPT